MEFVVALYPLASLWRLQNCVPIKIIDHRVIEHGDVGPGSRVDQGRGSQEGDSAGGGGGDVGQDREVWSDGCQYFDEEDRSEDEDDDYADSGDSGVHQIHP